MKSPSMPHSLGSERLPSQKADGPSSVEVYRVVWKSRENCSAVSILTQIVRDSAEET